MFTNTKLNLVGRDLDNMKKDSRYVKNCLWDHNKKLSENVDRTRAELKQEFHAELARIRRRLGR